ncbi:MAG TPA: MotA/TolQ/ExbB proton channel family protein [Gammaproteobacteria bacterium]|nr:MotA/TolQ/ExbB proton channel family protein [Gammaproteobacteria bacterium]
MERLYYFVPALRSVSEFMDLGGGVLILIVVLLLVMWTLIFERMLYINGPYTRLVEQTIAEWEARSERNSWHAHAIRERLISIVYQKLEHNMPLIKTCIALSPLLGLLGTVTGMIEVFEVMAISGSGNARSMAAGVSKATVPTMAGMVAALSGVAMHTLLSNKVAIKKEQLSDHMTTDH